MRKLDNSPTGNPNDNCNILHNVIETAANKHLPSKTLKYNKYKPPTPKMYYKWPIKVQSL